jgi:hypothetical protein
MRVTFDLQGSLDHATEQLLSDFMRMSGNLTISGRKLSLFETTNRGFSRLRL